MSLIAVLSATAAVAGLAAYFLALENVGPFPEIEVSSPTKLKEYILSLSWTRAGDMNTFFNGVRPSDAGSRSPLDEGELPDFQDCNQVSSSTEGPTTLLTMNRGTTDTLTTEADTASGQKDTMTESPIDTTTSPSLSSPSSLLTSSTTTTSSTPSPSREWVCEP
ncbi:hypothetical protein NW759_016730 [Fusarium solani]|nr:hypothetical protein NW759_016730 [Fusarium solani]